MINLEIIITLATMLVAFFMVVYMLQKGSVWKKRIKKDYETLDLARQIKCDTSKAENLTSLGLDPLFIKAEKPDTVKRQGRTAVVFSILIFCGFLGWAYYLMTRQLIEPAALTMVFALTCVLALLYAKRKIKSSTGEREKLRDAISHYERELAQPPAPVVAKSVPTAETAVPSLTELCEWASGFCGVPEDSTLRRHFLTQLMYQTLDSLGSRPTDSTLKRHYDTMFKSAFVECLQAGGGEAVARPKPAAEAVRPAAVSAPTLTPAPARRAPITSIPEDSTLRRHFLSQLRRNIEESHGNRPTDSTLRRHFDTMVDAEFDDRLQALSTSALRLAGMEQASATGTVVQTVERNAQLPEDSVLRRHFLTELKNRIMAKLPPKPSDFNLLRHYNAMIQSALDSVLEERHP